MRSFFFGGGFGHALNMPEKSSSWSGVKTSGLAQRSAQKSEKLNATMVVGLRQPSIANISNMENHYFAKQSHHLVGDACQKSSNPKILHKHSLPHQVLSHPYVRCHPLIKLEAESSGEPFRGYDNSDPKQNIANCTIL